MWGGVIFSARLGGKCRPHMADSIFHQMETGPDLVEPTHSMSQLGAAAKWPMPARLEC